MSNKKRQPLDTAAISGAAGETINPVEELEERRTARATQRSRVGKKQIQAYLPPQYRQQLKILSAKKDVPMEHLIAEALDDLFEKQAS